MYNASNNNRSNYNRDSRNNYRTNSTTGNYQNRNNHHHSKTTGGSRVSRVSRKAPSLRSTLRQQRNTKIADRQRGIMPIPPVDQNIRIITIGGVEEIGKNMLAIEIGQDIIIIDAGFQFKDASTPGIDYILPNTKYLEERKDKIRGLFVTHGHLDHIGAIPYILGKIGNPPIYSRKFGAIMIQKKMEDFPHLPKPDIRIIDGDETVRAGEIRVETFPISHTIPDSMGLIVKTEHGDLVIIEDVRVDNIEGVPTEEEVEHYKRFKDRKILLLTMDSTSIEKAGFSISENVVIKNIEKIISETKNRLIIGTFASQVERILAIIDIANRYGKKVVVEGRSMKSNLEIVKYLGLIKTDNVIPVSEIEKYPPDRIVMLVTGAQGEEFAALMRMANKSHKYITLRKTDTILLSSSIIPTNYMAVVKLKDSLYRSEAKVITYLDSDIHASGHGNRGELKWIHQQIPYKFFVPLHGNHFMLRQHAEMAESMGVKPENIIVPDNGSIIELTDSGQNITKLPVKAPNEPVTVDGLAVGTIQDVVLEDRQLLAEAGIFVIVASVNIRTGKLKKSPDIISRGFVYLRESQELLRKARFITQKNVENYLAKNQGPVDFDKIKKILSDDLSKFLFQETAKQPLVIPVIIGV
ncbi:MAG TPA: ribonuclease J [Candidatus Paceibacterota bacterium]|nr:ribonuclease J [Candidatus Paceibacterota bacterium]HMP19099.1 ribonuclease J [Candidatus Paceibacterota bacterium]HMP85103.1 ribonuclease J [Candidatus Paceibacterota bacterium]